MAFSKLSLAILFCGMMACSEGKDTLTEISEVTFQPHEKPAHPASSALLQQIFGDLKTASSYIPEDAAYFNSVIVGDTVREIYYGSYDHQRALKKLSPEGRALVKLILSNCRLNPAQRNDSGKPQPGNTVKTSIHLSSEGRLCPYVIKKSVHKTRGISAIKGDPKAGTAYWTENLSMSIEEHRDVRDATIRSLSQVHSLHFANKINGNLVYKASNTGFEIKALLKGTGQAEVAFANGLVLRGPVHSLTVTEDDNTTVKVRFLGSTGQGDILILVIRDDAQVLKVYVNGELASSDILDAFGLNLMEVASRRY